MADDILMPDAPAPDILLGPSEGMNEIQGLNVSCDGASALPQVLPQPTTASTASSSTLLGGAHVMNAQTVGLDHCADCGGLQPPPSRASRFSTSSAAPAAPAFVRCNACTRTFHAACVGVDGTAMHDAWSCHACVTASHPCALCGGVGDRAYTAVCEVGKLESCSDVHTLVYLLCALAHPTARSALEAVQHAAPCSASVDETMHAIAAALRVKRSAGDVAGVIAACTGVHLDPATIGEAAFPAAPVASHLHEFACAGARGSLVGRAWRGTRQCAARCGRFFHHSCLREAVDVACMKTTAKRARASGQPEPAFISAADVEGTLSAAGWSADEAVVTARVHAEWNSASCAADVDVLAVPTRAKRSATRPTRTHLYPHEYTHRHPPAAAAAPQEVSSPPPPVVLPTPPSASGFQAEDMDPATAALIEALTRPRARTRAKSRPRDAFELEEPVHVASEGVPPPTVKRLDPWRDTLLPVWPHSAAAAFICPAHMCDACDASGEVAELLTPAAEAPSEGAMQTIIVPYARPAAQSHAALACSSVLQGLQEAARTLVNGHTCSPSHLLLLCRPRVAPVIKRLLMTHVYACLHCARAYHGACAHPHVRGSAYGMLCPAHAHMCLPDEVEAEDAGVAPHTHIRSVLKRGRIPISAHTHMRMQPSILDSVYAMARVPKYTRIRSNVYTVKVKRARPDADVCTCATKHARAVAAQRAATAAGGESLGTGGEVTSPTAAAPPPRVCDDSCMNACMRVECYDEICSVGDECGNRRMQVAEHPATRVAPSVGKGWGLFAEEDISRGSFIVEYVGEIVDLETAKERLNDPTATHHYIMEIDAHTFIDARNKANVARFINHSCEPNARLERWNVCGFTRIGVFARSRIRAGEEITYDYQFFTAEATLCACGAAACRGYLTASSRDGGSAGMEEVASAISSRTRTGLKRSPGKKGKRAASRSRAGTKRVRSQSRRRVAEEGGEISGLAEHRAAEQAVADNDTPAHSGGASESDMNGGASCAGLLQETKLDARDDSLSAAHDAKPSAACGAHPVDDRSAIEVDDAVIDQDQHGYAEL